MILKFVNKIVFAGVLIIVGVVAGQYYLRDMQHRRPIETRNCDESVCLKPNEILGILASIGIKYGSDYLPDKLFETEKTIVIKHPTSKITDYLIIPKKDIKNIAEVSEEDKVYILDAIAAAQRVISDKKLTKYQLVTNGPGFQDVTYLHFHLVGE